MTSVGIVGARGHVGAELIRLLAIHPALHVTHVGSRELAGQPVPGTADGLLYEALSPGDMARCRAGVWILALPNGKAAPYVAALEASFPRAVVVDLSADYRFDDGWHYGLPELFRAQAEGQRRISNPGCYATAMQLALAPLSDLLDGPPACFGVSGYSGAGTTPSPRNDPERVADNLMPYGLVDHLHEREVTRHLGAAVHFLPHVAGFFRGLSITVDARLTKAVDLDEVVGLFRERYAKEPLVQVDEAGAPEVRASAGRSGATVGGFTVGDQGRRVVVVSTLDNLLKGAATQALQNVNLALGLEETLGIPAFA